MTFTAKFDGAEIQNGTYKGKLVSVDDVEKQKYDFATKTVTNELEIQLKFIFEVTVQTNAGATMNSNISYEVRKTKSPTGNLYKMLLAMTGNKIKGWPDEQIAQLIETLVGTIFFVRVEQSDSGYSNIKEIIALPVEEQTPAFPQPAVSDKQVVPNVPPNVSVQHTALS